MANTGKMPACPPREGTARDVRQFSADKILKHLDRVAEWQATGTTSPVTVELDLTNLCNHKCPECFGFSGPRTASLPEPLVFQVLDQLRQLGARAVTFTGGGEPLCHPALPRALTRARELGMDVALITNGQFLTPALADTILDTCTWVRVSLDAARPDTFALTHGVAPGHFATVTEKVRGLAESKRRRGSATTVGAGFLTGEETLGEMAEAARLARDLGVDYLQFRPLLRRHGEPVPVYRREPFEEQLERALACQTDAFRVLWSQHKYDSMQDEQQGRNYRVCHGHHFAPVIAADARMYVCCHLRGLPQYCLGDLARTSLPGIWWGRQRKEAYGRIDFRACPPLCRCNTFNQILWNIAQPSTHGNFL